MECLNPPVEFVPVEEWYCPGCSSHEDPEEHLEEEHREEGLREVPRARATRGRPRGSTARRVSVSGRTGLVKCIVVKFLSTDPPREGNPESRVVAFENFGDVSM